MPSLHFASFVTLILVPALNSTSASRRDAEYALMSLPCLPLITKRVFLLKASFSSVDELENAAQVWMLPGV